MKAGLFYVVVLIPGAAFAQINYSGGIYTQNFDALQDDIKFHPYTVMPDGWLVSHGAYVWVEGTNGYSNNYGTYCFASSAEPADKALGLVIGTTDPASFGAHFINATGATLNFFKISYYEEQWIQGRATNQDQVIPFQFSLTATNLISSTYTNFTALDMHSIHDGNGTFGALNGNDPTNRQFISAMVTNISWAPNQELWIRWVGVNYSFNSAHALAVDDLSFSALPEIIASSSASTLTLSWPTNIPGYNLQATGDLASTNWDAVTDAPVITNGQYRLDIATSNTQRFFRLIK